MVVPLPIGEPDDTSRLRLIAAETTNRKQKHRPAGRHAVPHPPPRRSCRIERRGGLPDRQCHQDDDRHRPAGAGRSGPLPARRSNGPVPPQRHRRPVPRPYGARLRCRHHPPTAAGPHQRTTVTFFPAADPGRGATRRRPAPVSRRWISSTWRRPASRRPRRQGRPRSYSDTGFLLAGLIIEALTRRPLQEAYRELVLDPAGMADMWLESSSEAPRRRDIASHDFDGRDIFWSPELDAVITGTVNTGRVDRRPLLGAIVRTHRLKTRRSGRPGIKVRGQQSAPLAFLASPQARWQGPLVRVNVSRGDLL